MRLKLTLPLLALIMIFAAFQSRANSLSADTVKSIGPLDTLKIVYFGSSVPFGYGAKNNFGYTAYYTEILKQRYAEGKGRRWVTVNKSVGGDNTIRLLARWDRDLVPQKAKYIWIALSLGNEGLHEAGRPKFEQFKANLVKLIAKAREYGYTPVVTNCYTRADFTASDYDFVKQTDLWIQTLDVPTVNLLGATDDGFGRWVLAYQFNKDHPNDGGHREMSYTIPPSLFDALADHKPMPHLVNGTATVWTGKTKQINFKPENTVHSFTTNISIKTDSKGQVMEIADSTGKKGSISVNANGTITYQSAYKDGITGTTKITGSGWHKITLTHYFERGETDLYCDSTLQGELTEHLVPRELTLGGRGLSAKNWLFYRAGMNGLEVATMATNTLLKSSLELYAPLDSRSKKPLANLAQSTNIIRWP